MDILIASNRQLPIRYYVDKAIWIRRGGCSINPQMTLPFFLWKSKLKTALTYKLSLTTFLSFSDNINRQSFKF